MDAPPQLSPRRATDAHCAPPAFEAVFRRHYAFVWRNLARLGVPDAALDDALQDVFVVVHRRLPQFVRRGSLRAWLFEIVRRVAWRHREAHKRHASHTETVEDLASPAQSVDAQLERRDALRLLDGWLAELDDDKRCAFIMAELEQFRGPEIARQLGVNVNTVYARVRAARQHVERRARRLSTVEDVGRLHAIHRRDRPSASRRRQVVAAVAAKTGTTLTATSAAPAASFGVVKLFTVVTLVAATATAVASSRDDGGREPTQPAAGIEARSGDSAPRRGASAAHGSKVESAPAEERETEASVDIAPSAPVAPAQTHARRRPASAPASAESRSPRPRTADALARDVALLAEAQRALQQGTAGAALRVLDTLLSTSSDSKIAPEARALRIQALCAAGRRPEAERAARAFTRRHPGSALVDADTICPPPK